MDAWREAVAPATTTWRARTIRVLLGLTLGLAGLLAFIVMGDAAAFGATTVTSNLAFASAPVSGSASSGADLGPIVVELEHSGSPITAPPGGVLISLDPVPSGGMFAVTPGGAAVTSVLVAAGTSSTSFYFGDTGPGSPVVTISTTAPGFTSTGVTQTETVTTGAPTRLAFASSPVSGTASSSAGLGPITVDLENGSTPAPAPAGGITVQLASTSPGGEFSTSAGGASTSYIFIPAGATSGSFFYGDTHAGTPTLTASASGIASASQAESVQAATSPPPPPVDAPPTVSNDPSQGSGPILGTAAVTLTVPCCNSPQQGLPVVFTITSGPDAPRSLSTTTNGSGLATWTYQNNGQAGTDVITVSVTDADGTVQHVGDAWVWTAQVPSSRSHPVTSGTTKSASGTPGAPPVVGTTVPTTQPPSTKVVSGGGGNGDGSGHHGAAVSLGADCAHGHGARCESLAVEHSRRGGPAVSALVESVLKPAQVSFNGKLLLENALLALLLLLLIDLPAEIFNATLNEHNDKLTGRAGKIGNPIRRVEQLLEDLPNAVVLGSFALVGAILYGLIDPGFGLNRQSAALILGLICSLAVITVAHELIRNIYMERNFEKRGTLKAFPIGLIIAAILVVASRVAHFEPGYMFGVLAALTFRVEPTVKEEGRSLAFASVMVFALGLGSWFLWVPITDAVAKGNGGFAILVLDAFLATTWVVAMQSLLFSLVPLKFLDGNKVMAWNRFAWVGVYFLGLFIFVQTMMHPRNGQYGGDTHASLASMLVLFLAFMAAACLFWLYFRVRPLWHHDDEEVAEPQESSAV